MTINVFGCDIWFCIRPNLGPFLASSEVPKVPNFCYYMSSSPALGLHCETVDTRLVCHTVCLFVPKLLLVSYQDSL